MRSDWNSLTLEEARALPETARGKGIYFLWDGDDLLYIGASTQVMERIDRQAQFRDFGHMSTSNYVQAKPHIPFNRATILKCDTVTAMAELEKTLIKRWWPPYNDRADDGDMRWNDRISDEQAELNKQVAKIMSGK